MGSWFGAAARRRRGIAVLLLLGAWAVGDGAVSSARAQALPVEPVSVEPMTDAQAAAVGCVLVAAGVGVATVTAGGVALAAAGVGATSTAVVVPVVVATMAGGCTLGATAAPAFLWAKSHGHTLTGTLTGVLGPWWPGASE